MNKMPLNHGWTVKAGDGTSLGELMGNNSQLKEVTLPHDFLIESPRNPQESNGSGNGFFHETDLVYKKMLTLDHAVAGKRIWIEFEGVYQNAFVYVNNAYAGKCAYGYSNFYLDITRFVTMEKENEIKVIVKNGVPSGRWYTGGGIYRNVNLMITNPTHIIPDGVFVKPVDVEEEFAVVDFHMEIANEVVALKSLVLKTTILDADGNKVTQGSMPVTMFENTFEKYKLRTYVKNPNLWSVETPYLYRYKVEILDGEEVLDTEEGNFGMRKLQLDPVHGLRINGKTVKLRGGCIHHDNGIIGTREFDFAAEYRIKTLKECGFNAVRSSHYPISRQLLDACDRYGMLVIDEFSDVWTTAKVAYDYGVHMTEWWEHDISNMVRKDKNHPSVIIYSIGNEIPETGNAIDNTWGKKFADKIRELDDTRFTVNSMNLFLSGMGILPSLIEGETEMDGKPLEINSLMNDLGKLMEFVSNSPRLGKAVEEAANQVDIVGYNYTAGRYLPEGTEYPNRVLIGTETYSADLDKNWELVMKLPYVLGDFNWTAWDYLGENGIGGLFYNDEGGNMYNPYPFKAAYCGDVDLLGDRRAVSYWRECVWGLRTDPYIAVQPPKHYGDKRKFTQWAFSDAVRSWNFAGFDQKPVIVEIYSDADEVELFVNNKSIGKKSCGETKGALTLFDTIYESGKMEAVSFKNGQRTGNDILYTASEEIGFQTRCLCANENENVIPADGSDIAYVDLYVVDERGYLNIDIVRDVEVSIEDPGEMIGYGSASPCNEENYYDRTAKTYEGRLRASVRAYNKGNITVCFKSGDLSSEIVIEAR